jgi:protein ImuB
MSSTAFSKPTASCAPSGPLYGALYIPDFPAQASIRNAPDLGNRPVAILDGTDPLLKVVAMNARARRLGVRPGMTRLQLDPFSGLHIRQRSSSGEATAHGALLDCAHAFTPRIEETASDTITLDLNGLSGLWGSPRAIAQKLLRAASRLGLEVHVAVAPNPDAAILATRSGAGITVIRPGEAAGKLAALPLEVLDSTQEMQETFQRWGLRTLGDLRALPATQIAERLGQDGVRLRDLAGGATERPLRPASEHPHFAESMELETPIDSLEPLTFILSRLMRQLCQRLTARNRAASEIRLTLDMDSARSRSFGRQIRMPVPTREPKLLLKLLQLDLDAHRPPEPVTHITLEATPAPPRRIQNGLFQPLAPEPEKLELTLARIAALVGDDNIGTPVLIDSHRPDAFRMRRFRVLSPGGRARSGAPGKPATSMALRMCRPPQPITVETDQGRPARILFAGQRGQVVHCAGPWSASGDWWRSDAWNREEWDVEVRTGWRRTLCRIYRDPRRDCWYLDASYD